MKSTLSHAWQRLGESSKAARLARETTTFAPQPETFRSAAQAQCADAVVDAFVAATPAAPAQTGQVRLHGKDERAMAAAWQQCVIGPSLDKRHTRSRNNVQDRKVLPPSLPPVFPGMSASAYSADGRFVWAAFGSHFDRDANQLHDLLSGTTHSLRVGDEALGEGYEGRFSADGTHIYAYGGLGCHVFDIRGVRPVLTRSVYLADPHVRAADSDSEPVSTVPWAVGETITFELEPAGGAYAELENKLVGFDGNKAYIALSSRQGPALFALEGHTTPIEGIVTSNHCDDLVTLSDNEALWWRFDSGVARSTPMPGLSFQKAQGGIILDDHTLLLTGGPDASEGGIWRLSNSVWAPTQAVVKAEGLAESAKGEFVALLGNTDTTFLQRTAFGYQPLGSARHPEGSERLWNCKFEAKNPRLFGVDYDKPWFWLGERSVELLNLPGLGPVTRGRPDLSDDQQQAYLIMDGKLKGYDLSGSSVETLALPLLPEKFQAGAVIAQNKVVVALSADGKEAWHWRQDGDASPQHIQFPENLRSVASENAVSPDGKLLSFVAADAAYVLDLRAPDASPLSLKDEAQRSTSGVSLVAGGTVALVKGTNKNGYAERYFDLAAAVPAPRAKF